MELNRIIETLKGYYKDQGIDKWLGDNQIICRPNDQVWYEMLRRNPSVKNEITKLNSSTALAINYHELLARECGITCAYEYPLAKPLKMKRNYGCKAMIDVMYTWKDITYFVESKFLEPYYCGKHAVSESYFDPSNYVSNGEFWANKFKEVEGMIKRDAFKYYDIYQMMKHLLAMYNMKLQGEVVLKNLIWKPTEVFMNTIKSQRSRSFLTKRITKLGEEMKTAEQSLNNIISELNWSNCSVVIGFYNDELGAVSSNDEFKRKYLM